LKVRTFVKEVKFAKKQHSKENIERHYFNLFEGCGKVFSDI
jgi:hypothetical protein